MKQSIRNISFRSKITLVFTIVCMAISSICGMVYYNYAKREIVAGFQDNAEGAIRQLESTLDARLGNINRRAASTLSNTSFTEPLVTYLSAPSDRNYVEAMGSTSNFLKDIRLGEPLISSVMVHTERKDLDDFSSNRLWEFDFEDSVFLKAYETEPDIGIKWLPAMEDEIFYGKTQVIPYIRRFRIWEYPVGYQYLIIQLDQKELLNVLNGNYERYNNILILDRNGKLIANTFEIDEKGIRELSSAWEGETAGISSQNIDYAGEAYLVSRGDLDLNGWQIYILKPESEMLDNINQVSRLIILLTAGLTCMSLLIVAFFAHQLTSSLKRLAFQMTRMKNGELDARYYYPYRDEVGSLAKSFNFMADEIQHYVKKQEEYIQTLKEERDFAAKVQKQKRKAELQALQAQINPHFLYNTLNAITWQAADQGVDEISILSNSLGKFFRLSLSKGAEVIPVRDEAEHVRSYLSIQEIRYADKMRYEIRIPEAVMEKKTLKLVLQPLVENAIYHGIKPKAGIGHIQITASLIPEEDREIMRFVVEDDGMGIPAGKLDLINQGLSEAVTDHKEGYGIYNVNERIRLYYGKDYGLRYESLEGYYTRAILTMPAGEQEVD